MLSELEPALGIAEADLLRFAAAVERGSEHPLAAAIAAGAKERGVEVPQVEAFASRTGLGLTGEVEGRRVAIGNEALMEELEVDAAGLHERAQELRGAGRTVVLVALDGAGICASAGTACKSAS